MLVLHNSGQPTEATPPAALVPNSPPPDPTPVESTESAPAAPPTLAEPDLERIARPRYLQPRRAMTPDGVRAVAEALSSAEFTVSVVDIADNVDRLMSAVVVEKPALVFNLISEFEANPEQAALVPSLLDLLGVIYTGSAPLALATCQNRSRAHLVLDDAEIPVASDDSPLGPRRIHAVVLGNQLLEVLPLVESVAEAPTPAALEPAIATAIRKLARRAFRALDCRDFAQVDFELDGAGQPCAVEVRGLIDFDRGSPLSAATEVDGRGFHDTIVEIARIACARAGVAVPADVAAQPGDQGDGDSAAAAATADRFATAD